jgi:hypothetical protein
MTKKDFLLIALVASSLALGMNIGSMNKTKELQELNTCVNRLVEEVGILSQEIVELQEKLD